jgi:hypothetical protein
MSQIIYKEITNVRWNSGKELLSSTSVGGNLVFDFMAVLANYYTKVQLNTAGLSQVDFANITNAYHNDLLGLQGGQDNSANASSSDTGQYYHLSEYDYDLITTIPNPSYYFGTNAGGVKGWYAMQSGGDSLWLADSIGDLYTVTAGAGVYIDDIKIKDGKIKNELGILSLESGDGDLYLIPGNNDSQYIGTVYIGNSDSTNTPVQIMPEGNLQNIDLALFSKGNGIVYLGTSFGSQIMIEYFDIVLASNSIILGKSGNFSDILIHPYNGSALNGINVVIEGGESNGPYLGGNLSLKGGHGEIGGGNVYIYGGDFDSAGVEGNIYLGDGNEGKLPAKTSETNIVYYDPTTGKLSYGAK